MAAEPPAMAVNGNYYDIPEQNYTTRDTTTSPDYASADPNANAASGNGASGNNSEIPKDEVGWYFVEQYYTTLSKSPEKLFLFYNKSSQFVSGTETEKAPVCVGQKAISDRIKELDIQDCKVRVTNVDSQGSQSNIVIQVIGEISNKSAPQRKFTQTFVLAEQSNGYFVLNDIFRYLLDEEEEYGPPEGEAQEAQPEVTTEDQEVVAAAPAEVEARQAPLVDEVATLNPEPAQTVETQEPLVAETEPTVLEETVVPPAAEVVHVEDAPAAAVTTSVEEPVVEQAIEQPPAEEQAIIEKPQEVPAPSSAAPAQPVAEAAPKPAAPKTWANLVRGNSPATPVAPVVPAVPASAASAAVVKPAPTVQTAAPAVPAATSTSAKTVPSATPQDSDQVGTPQSSGSEWQTAGQEHSRKQSRTQGAQTPAENSRAYIKNVNESIDIASLQAALIKIADIAYIDINRQKNCAFVDFSTPAGYKAAVAANPHEVGGERLYVEERRVRPPGYNGRGGARGSNVMRGAPAPGGPGRGTFNKDGPRGNYGGARGRGGANARGRGGVSQAI